MIQILSGSIFDVKCDLIIIPCDSNGGVTQSVFENLNSRKLLTNVGAIPYGNVYFLEVNYEFANTIGYAASVNGKTILSNDDAIKQIALGIVQYSKANQIGIVNIPLLGSGAGKMSPIQSFEALKTILEKEENITFNIFCYTKNAYNNILASDEKPILEKKINNPRVFISYAGNDKMNASWVKSLAEALRKNGVDARLDVFHLKPGYDLPQWMTSEVIKSDKVLLICDKYYMEKADFRKGGVGWETMIIQGDMLIQGDNKQKYIAIIREDEPDKALPIYIKSKYAFNWGKSLEITDERIKELLLTIFDCDTEPELGSIPDYVLQKIKR